MDRLPNELLSVIFATAAATLRHAQTETGTTESSSPRPRTRWLAELSLVSRRFHTVVQSIMFDVIVVASEKQLRLLAAHLEQNPSLAAKPISLVILATDSAQPKHAAKAWRKAVLRFGRCRPNVHRLEVYGRQERQEFGYFDLSWLKTIHSSLEELIVSHLRIAHHDSLDDFRLTTLRRFTAAAYSHYSPPPEHNPSNGRPPRVHRSSGIAGFHRFLRCMPAIERLELLDDDDDDAPAVHDMSLEEGPPMLQNIKSLTIELDALVLLLHIQDTLAYSRNDDQPHTVPPFTFCGSTIQHLTAVDFQGPPLVMSPDGYSVLDQLLHSRPSLQSLTFVNVATPDEPDFDREIQESLQDAQAAGYALDLQLRVISAEDWVAERDDLVRDGWTTPEPIIGPRQALQQFLREQGIVPSQR